MAAAGGGGYTATAVVFDGTNDYLNRGADLSSNADAKTFIFSAWVNLQAAATNRLYITANSRLHIRFDNTGQLLLTAANTAGTNILVATVTSPTVSTSAWTHIAVAIDLANSANRSVYIGGTLATVTWTTYTNANIDFTDTDHYIGSSAAPAVSLNAYIAEYYLAFGQYLDLSTNLTKFRTSGNKPVSLGSNGATPTGSQPSIYLAGTASTFATNKGAGGGFTVTGTLTDAPSAP